MAKTEKKLSQQALKKAAWRHAWALQWCWNYERMQASGFAYTMLPIMQELYDDNEEVCQNLERHMQFYNSHPGASALIAGASAALEGDYQTEMSDSIKVALMGPMAGIGDTIQAVLVQPLAFMLGASLAAEGNFLGVLVILIPMLLMFWARWPLFYWGYNRSVKIIDDISGNSDFNDMRDAAGIMGLLVVGGFVPSILGVRAAWTFERVVDGVELPPLAVADVLDRILPHMIPILMVAFCYWLLKEKKVKPVRVILILAVVTFVLGAAGVIF
ncbi:MAG: PTS system mannose/fructose/sorbose family transporter subunit IID [Defluviitaleaceae bacterium]|nr:PTS system mannose/fructose/sorbose family transporter subunit IID [Defluviitaleaceae bacterium]